MIWCELCRDHYEIDHFSGEGLVHMTGKEYGSFGEILSQLELLDDFKVALRLYTGQLETWRLTSEQEEAVKRALAAIDDV